jgi:hypothetical protein
MLHHLILLLQSSAAASSGKGLSVPWAIVGFLIAIGLAITLSPSRRTSEIKRQRED